MSKLIQKFERTEKKYLLTASAYRRLKGKISEYVKADEYGNYTICSIYYDSPNYQLIRASIEKPIYKEKLRLRSYGVPSEDTPVFMELKKKCKGVVYKRRESARLDRARNFLEGNTSALPDNQILRELDWTRRRYALGPRVYIAYDREAYVAKDDQSVRLTFDHDIRFRDREVDLASGDWGDSLFTNGQILMEIKTLGAMPLWLCTCLTDEHIYPTSFSKYGTIYKSHLSQGRKEVFTCA